MCGILAFSSPKDKKFNKDKVKLLFLANQERGKDSLGYFTPEVGVVKELGKAEEVMSKKDFDIQESSLLIGHIRAATIGSVNKKNAHPFQYGNIVLAMNGTLSNHWELLREYKLVWEDYDVDSQVLAAMLNVDQSKDPLSKIVGGCAIVYADTNTNKLYCYRNSDRPLYRGCLDDCIYVSSLENSLKVIGCSNVKEFKQDTLYEIQDGKILNHYKVKRAGLGFSQNLNVHYKKISMLNTPNKDLVGMYLEPEYPFTEGFKNFEKGRFYKVVDYEQHNSYNIGVMNDGVYIKVSKFKFSEHIPIIGIKDYVIALCPLVYNNSKEHVGEEGDVYIVNSLKKGAYSSTNLRNGKDVSIPHKYVRYASKKEVDEFLSKHTTKEFPTCPVGCDDTKEEDIFKKQIVETSYDSIEELADFTLMELLDQITNLEEITSQETQLTIIDNMKTLIGNYSIKSSNFSDKETTDAN